MDEKKLQQDLAEELVQGWEIIPTGDGWLVASDWHWPDRERIEVYVRTVGEREDLYIISDGGELCNLLFAEGIDASKDEQAMRVLNGVAESNGAKIVDYQLVKGAGESDLARGVRAMVEAIKDASFLLWHRIDRGRQGH